MKKRIISLFLVCFLLCGCTLKGTFANLTDLKEDIKNETETLGEEVINPDLEVHFIDVGQGDCTLIASEGHYMLIDAGDNDKGTLIQNYLYKRGIKELEYIVGTHPDADHIGGMDVILYKFDCKNVFMPEVENDTYTYRDVVNTLKQKGYVSQMPETGREYQLGKATFTVLAPDKSYEKVNDNSICILLTYEDTKFLFVGDAEEEEETDILGKYKDIKADVYKVAHHGSSTGSTEDFLKAVSPKYAVISCGKNNDYGHPHQIVLKRLEKFGIEVFRTDQMGTIVLESDGKEIILKTN